MSIVAGELPDGILFNVLLSLSPVGSGLQQLRMNKTSLRHLDNKVGVKTCSARFILTRPDLLDITSVDGVFTLLYICTYTCTCTCTSVNNDSITRCHIR